MNEIWKYRLLYVAMIIVLAALDQATKWWAVINLGARNLPITIIPNYLELKLTYNTGAVWGIFPGWTQGLAVLSTAMIIVILALLGRTHLKDRLLGWAFTFQLGGAVGNLIDRISYRKSVADFINAYIPLGGGEGGFWYRIFDALHLDSAREFAVNKIPTLYNWPTFNLADSWVVIGTLLLLIYIIIMPPEKPKEPVTELKLKELPNGSSLLSSEKFPDTAETSIEPASNSDSGSGIENSENARGG